MLTLAACASGLAQDNSTNAPNRLIIHADQGKNTISRNIYGHFSEHLGRCVYEGIWVGENSPIPNTRGIRNDVVAALKKIKVPALKPPALQTLTRGRERPLRREASGVRAASAPLSLRRIGDRRAGSWGGPSVLAKRQRQLGSKAPPLPGPLLHFMEEREDRRG